MSVDGLELWWLTPLSITFQLFRGAVLFVHETEVHGTNGRK
jgi:hypothetical protein